MSIEFKEWPKTPRLMRDIVITEKLDGTNAAIGIVKLSAEDLDANSEPIDRNLLDYQEVQVDGEWGIYGLYAQSRNKLIFPGKQDHYGLAGWVSRNRHILIESLGEGLHYGEWWGNGIQRNYGMAEKWFSLFNTDRYAGISELADINITTVPVLYSGPNNTAAVQAALESLRDNGSVAAPGFMNPEGICVYHTSSRQVFKVTLDKNDAGKWEAEAA